MTDVYHHLITNTTDEFYETPAYNILILLILIIKYLIIHVNNHKSILLTVLTLIIIAFTTCMVKFVRNYFPTPSTNDFMQSK